MAGAHHVGKGKKVGEKSSVFFGYRHFEERAVGIGYPYCLRLGSAYTWGTEEAKVLARGG